MAFTPLILIRGLPVDTILNRYIPLGHQMDLEPLNSEQLGLEFDSKRSFRFIKIKAPRQIFFFAEMRYVVCRRKRY